MIVEYHSGNINIDEFIQSRKTISQDPDFNPDFDILFDFRDANMLVNQADIKKFSEFFKGYSPIIGNRKSAYITSKPNQVAITTIFSMEIEDISVNPRTFSTVEGAVGWIANIHINKSFIQSAIRGLRTKSVNIYSR